MTVLNTIELTKWNPVLDGIFIACLIVMIVSFISTFTVFQNYDMAGGVCMVLCAISLLVMFVCAALSDTITVPSGKVQYEILIDDNVAFSEVIEKYDIVEQRGEIFVVEEKE